MIVQNSNNQIEEILYELFGKKVTDNSISLFAAPYALKPRDILYMIYQYIVDNNLIIRIMPNWDYQRVNILSLFDYCMRLQKMNIIGEKDD